MILNIKKEKHYALFVAGDFNSQSQSWYPDGASTPEGVSLDELFSKLDLTQFISEPTHFFREDCRPSCIDLILTDQPNLVLDSGVRPSLDPPVKHQITYCKINYKVPFRPKFKRLVWHYNRANVDLIRRSISEFSWIENLRLKTPSQQVDLLSKTILNIISNFTPHDQKIFSPHKHEWIDRNITSLLRKQNKLFKKFRKNGFRNEDKIRLDGIRAECSNAILIAKETFLKRQGAKLSDPALGQKAYWKLFNTFLNKCKIPRIPPLFYNNKFITDFKEKATIFNTYFASQCTLFYNDSQLPRMTYFTRNRMSTFVITENEIATILQGLNITKSTGPDNISANMLKLCGPDLSIPLKIIFDNILETGEFPEQWKEANITPVHKENDKQQVTNYRPISLLPILAKVFERVIFKNVYNHLITNNLITENQSGFRPNDSCTNQLLSIVHEIHTAFDDKNCLEVRSVFLDLSRAFDKVWHEGLIFKLEQNGINGKLLFLPNNYLKNHKQRVVLDGKQSDWASVESGVPQG